MRIVDHVSVGGSVFHENMSEHYGAIETAGRAWSGDIRQAVA